jgi:hypothetical protein
MRTRTAAAVAGVRTAHINRQKGSVFYKDLNYLLGIKKNYFIYSMKRRIAVRGQPSTSLFYTGVCI